MYSVLILEDDHEQRKGIETILKEAHHEWHIFSVSSYDEAVSLLNTNTYDFFLLDIILSDDKDAPTGLDFGFYIRSLPKYRTTPIIFLTVLTDGIYPAVQELHCYSYLTKPYSGEKLLDALNHFTASHPSAEQEIIFSNSKNTFYKFLPSQIKYFESQHRNTLVHTNDFTATLKRTSLHQIATHLPETFLQIHRCYIINMQKITSYDKTKQFVTIDSHKIPLGRTYKCSFETMFFS